MLSCKYYASLTCNSWAGVLRVMLSGLRSTRLQDLRVFDALCFRVAGVLRV